MYIILFNFCLYVMDRLQSRKLNYQRKLNYSIFIPKLFSLMHNENGLYKKGPKLRYYQLKNKFLKFQNLQVRNKAMSIRKLSVTKMLIIPTIYSDVSFFCLEIFRRDFFSIRKKCSWQPIARVRLVHTSQWKGWLTWKT